jgi:PAS domain S-box-containing protein
MNWKRFVLRILFPTGLAVVLFMALLFVILLPDVERNFLERKRELIRELTRSAVSVLKEYQAEERSGRMTRDDAQAAAIARIRDLRYGPEDKDYFWITDKQPRMIMHPFRTDLDGKDVSDFKDPRGNPVFVEFVRRVQESGSGYVDYVWQWKDDPGRLVPKESFVQGFEPWGWVIGTGIYTEDVRAEVAALTGRMVRVSIVFMSVVSLILLFVSLQSLRIERQRWTAEAALRESHERYRALVEASTEGTLMVLDGRCAYSNPVLQEMLGRSAEDVAALSLLDLLPDREADPARRFLEDVLEARPAPSQFEAQLRHADGGVVDVLLTATRIAVSDRPGVIVTARDIGRTKRVEEELGESRERYQALRTAIGIGVFRTTAGRQGRLVEANPAARRMFGFPDAQPVPGTALMDLCFDPEDRDAIAAILARDGALRDRVLRIRRLDGASRTVRVSAVLVRDEGGFARYCDGIVEDISDAERRVSEREALIEELQTSLRFLDEPVSQRAADVVSCPLDATIARAAAAMSLAGRGAILVTGAADAPVGIVTDRDLRERVVAEGLDTGRPVYEVMSAPILSIEEGAPTFEALLLMRDRGARHLAVRDGSGRVVGLVAFDDLMAFHRYSSAVLVHEIGRARNLADIIAARGRLPILVKALSDWGARPRTVTRVITSVSDAVTARLVELAAADLGPAPARFAFLALGSEGRDEQTLSTDQDNAIVYEDVAPERREEVAAWFQRLGEFVCAGLRDAGYELCQGEAMARNPKWCQPLSRWKEYFGRWIRVGTPQDLLSVNMFFDFRAVAGDPLLAADLRGHIDGELAASPAFFVQFAQNALLYKLPLGMFGKIVTGAEGQGHGTFSVKEALMPIVNFARLYSLRHGVDRTNTLERLHRLHDTGVLTSSSHTEIVAAYDVLMEIRLRHQASAAVRGVSPDNAVNPKDLSELEEVMVRKALAQVALVLKKISFDYLGSA